MALFHYIKKNKLLFFIIFFSLLIKLYAMDKSTYAQMEEHVKNEIIARVRKDTIHQNVTVSITIAPFWQ